MISRKMGWMALGAICMHIAAGQAQTLKTNTDSVAYALGMDVGSSLGEQDLKIDSKSFLKGFNDGLAGEKRLIGQEEGIRLIKAAFAEAAEKKRVALKAAETAFFESIKNKKGVQHLESGLCYEVLEEGSGVKPTIADKVTVHYKGTLADGKVFDDSRQRGEPLDLELSNVIPGWQEGIPLMSTGSKYRLYIPSALGYGERGAGPDIPPYSALIFEIELIGIKGDVVEPTVEPTR